VAERTEELRREIEETRGHLGDTLDSIGDRVSPGRVVERRWNRTRNSVFGVRDRVMGQAGQSASDASGALSRSAGSVTDAVRNAPGSIQEGTQGNALVAGAIAFGVGLLLGSLAPPTETEKSVATDMAEPVQRQLADIGHRVGDTAQSAAKEAVASTKDTATEAAQQVKSQAQQATDEVRSEAQGAKEEVTSQAQDAAQQAKDQAKGPSVS